MNNTDRKIPREELASRLQTLMFLRVIFVSLFLGASIFIQVRETHTYFGNIQTSHYILIGSIYFATFIYVLFLKFLADLLKLAYFQLVADTFFITAIIYATGGIESIFSFLYILTIINASIILYQKGGMIIASSCSLLYGLLLDLHYYNIIHPLGSRLDYSLEYQNFYIFYMIMVNIAAFYFSAFLSSYPSEQARKSRLELSVKQKDIIKLEALNEWIIRSIASGLITLDHKGEIILFNPAAEKIFCIKADQAIGRKIADLFPAIAEHLQSENDTSHSGSGERPGIISLNHESKDGSLRFLRFFVSPLNIPETGTGGQILFFQDETDMKKIEEEMKKVEGLAMIGELAAGIAHEIRNPMASISGSIQVMKESMSQDAVNNKLMDIVVREVDRLNHLVGDFLLFARPKPVEFKEFDLNQLIRESFELFKNSGKWNSNMELETDFHDGLALESDPEQIKQILWNLFLNANDAMLDKGTLFIYTCMAGNEDLFGQKTEMIKIVFRDTGHGFSNKALSHLFIPFFTTKVGGSGLGLATVKRILDGLQGHVYGRNHFDGGAEVIVLLPKKRQGPGSSFNRA